MFDTPLPLIIFWLFAVGAAVGSFLNVVVYRLPHGISLIYPPSRCPKCANHIAWYDNVPIFGWIMLRGRCRKCHNPISARYPLVEAVTAVMFALLGVAELPDYLAFYPYHVLLLCTLLCAGLIEYDGTQPPWRLFVPAVVVGVGMQMLLPELRPTATGWWGLSPSLVIPVDVLALLMLLGTFGWALYQLKATGFALSLVCVIMFLGWQALCVIAVAVIVAELLFWLVRYAIPKFRVPPSMMVGILVLAWILVWARLVSE